MVLPILAAASVIEPILAEAGTTVLARIIQKKLPGAGGVVRELATALGVKATPEAIAAAYKDDPGPVVAAAKDIESSDPAYWQYLAQAGTDQAALIKREDERDNWFAWAWRPAMCWLLIVLWGWNGLLLQVVNAAFGAAIEGLSIQDLLAYSGIWLTIYGGGHTVKAIADRYAETKIATAAK